MSFARGRSFVPSSNVSLSSLDSQNNKRSSQESDGVSSMSSACSVSSGGTSVVHGKACAPPVSMGITPIQEGSSYDKLPLGAKKSSKVLESVGSEMGVLDDVNLHDR